MNAVIKVLVGQAGLHKFLTRLPVEDRVIMQDALEEFAGLIVKKTLDEVAERAYYSGDRAWSNDADRKWVELEFSLGSLADVKLKG